MIVCGVDEVGRGPLAGPVVAAAVAYPAGYTDPAIKDSKKLSPKKREQLYSIIAESACGWAIAAIGPRLIDRVNIREATRIAMSAAAGAVQADRYLIDGNMQISISAEQETVIGGDKLHVQISAASILAKVWRDREMARLDEVFSGYGFNQHSGYPTRAHKKAIVLQGPSPVHRFSFKGVKDIPHTASDRWPAGIPQPAYMLQDVLVINDGLEITAHTPPDRSSRGAR